MIKQHVFTFVLMDATQDFTYPTTQPSDYSNYGGIGGLIDDIKLWISKHYPQLTFSNHAQTFKMVNMTHYDVVFTSTEEVHIPESERPNLPPNLRPAIMETDEGTLAKIV